MRRLIRTARYLLGAIRVQRNWIDQVRYVLGVFPPEQFEMRLRNGYELRADYCDRGACNEVWIEGMYAIGEPMHKWKTIIDVGSHVGATVLFFAAKSPGARIMAFEPSVRNCSILLSNIRWNDLAHRVSARLRAVCGESGEKTFYLMKDTGGNSLFPYERGEATTVQATTLEEIFADWKIDRCDLLKLDCEGAEYEILYTAREHILNRIDRIILEYHHFADGPHGNPEDLKKFLVGHGFEVKPHRKSMFYAIRLSRTTNRA